ncbi:uncharacterized protein [Pleurodeles waltl]|uniref:uncharacterized protein n=1 Tax=Pleurodeles waltl TaxID=8319 RepID=UPI003709949C
MMEEAVTINDPAEFPMKGYEKPPFQDDENKSKWEKPKKRKKRDENDKFEEPTAKMVGLLEMLSFADRIDIFLMTAGIICAIVNGLGLPLMIVIFGQMIDIFVKGDSGTTNSSEEFNR